MAEALARPLRFGIMYDGSALHSFQAQAINALVERGAAEPALLIIDGREGSAQAQSAVIQRRLFAPNLLWRLYARFDQPRALARVPLPDYCVGLPRIVCAPTREGWSEYFSDADAAAIRSYDFDFILRFGFGIIRGKILDSARFGVWSFHHGDEARYRGGPPGFWEIYDGAAVSGAILQRLTDRLDSGIVLRRGYLKTLDYSYARNLNRLLLESADWPALVASDIRAGADVDRLPASRSQARIRRTPSNIEMLRFFPRLARNVVRRAFERTTREEWNVGVVRLSPKEVVAGGTVGQVRWVPPLPGRMPINTSGSPTLALGTAMR